MLICQAGTGQKAIFDIEATHPLPLLARGGQPDDKLYAALLNGALISYTMQAHFRSRQPEAEAAAEGSIDTRSRSFIPTV